MKIMLRISSVLLLLCGAFVQAQDTSKRKTLNITSTFKPVLREASKLYFTASPLQPDTNIKVAPYQIPQQQLALTYQPVSLNPTALTVDSLTGFKQNRYVKAGIGNVHLPYLEAGYTIGNGKDQLLKFYGQHFSSKGAIEFQQNNQTKLEVSGIHKTGAGIEWQGKVGFKTEDFFYYGFQPQSLPFDKEDLRIAYQGVDVFAGMRNTEKNEWGVTFNPSLSFRYFTGTTFLGKATESNTVLQVPIEKSFGKLFSFKLGITADLTRLAPERIEPVINNLFYLSPSLFFKSPNFFMQTGIIPSWDNKTFHMLPNIQADITTSDKRFTLQAGFLGYYQKGSYQRFSSINPWMAMPTSLNNTRIREMFVGVKGNIGDYFSFNGKLGYMRYHNMPLFVNDTIDGKTFRILNGDIVDALQIRGEVSYTKGESFWAKAGVTINQFSKTDGQPEPWGLLPVELNGSLRWQLREDLWIRTDLFVFDGATFRGIDKTKQKGEGGFDLNLGAEFNVYKRFHLWLQMNNLFNNRYERWNQYEVFGFNVLGGLVYRW